METATWPAHCPACARRYRVKSLGRALACKHCGAELVVDAAPPAEASPETAPAADAPAPAESRTSDRSGEDASREFQKAIAWIEPLRGLLVCRAVTFAAITLAAILVDAASSPINPALMPASACLTAGFTVGAILLRHHPYPISVALACAEVAILGFLVLNGTRIPWLSASFTVGTILGAVQMRRVQRVLREHPLEWGARVFLGVRSARRQRATAEELSALRTRAHRRGLAWSAAAVVLIFGVTAAAHFGLPAAMPRAVAHAEPSLEFDEGSRRFEAAWHGEGTAALLDLWPTNTDKVRAGFLAALDLRGWTLARPALRSSRFSAHGTGARHTMEIPGGDVVTTWALDSGSWRLQTIEMPLPLVRGFADEFTARWNAGERESIQALFVANDGPDDASKRDLRWESGSPPVKIRDWGEQQRSVHEVDVTFWCEGGQIVSRCVLTKGGVWRIKSLELPY